MYGRGTKSVAEQIGIKESEAAGLIAGFFDKYPVARMWLEKTKAFAKKYGYVVSHFGRIRRLPTIFSTDRSLQSEAERQSINAPIQSAAADITGIFLIKAWNIIKERNLDAMPVLTVHDSVVFEVAEKHTQEFVKALKNEADRGVKGINIPMPIEMEIGKNWNELIPIGES